MPVKTPIPGQSLADLFPEVATQWHPTKNGSLKPTNVKYGSNFGVWWLCKGKCGCTHEWKSAPAHRTQGWKSGCPYCSKTNRKVCCRGLKTEYPEIYAQLHPTLNRSIDVANVAPGGDRVLWFLCPNSTCEHDHCYKAVIHTKTRLGVGCPFCAIPAKTVCPCNSLLAKRPEIAAQVDQSRSPMDCSTLSVNSNKYLWWKCDKHGSWKTKISMRTRADIHGGGTGCPSCRESQLEKLAFSVLTEMEVPFSAQHRCPVGVFDFFIEEVDGHCWLLEVDGEQHFIPTAFGSTIMTKEEGFADNLRRDRQKNQWTKEVGIPLLRIPYTHCTADQIKADIEHFRENYLRKPRGAGGHVMLCADGRLYAKVWEEYGKSIEA